MDIGMALSNLCLWMVDSYMCASIRVTLSQLLCYLDVTEFQKFCFHPKVFN